MSSDSALGDTQLVEEGSATVRVPADVFYNPVQVFNRDLTISVANVFGQLLLEEAAAKNKERGGVQILEALAASGLRSMRFAKEVANVSCIVANDNNPQAVRLISANAEANGVTELVEASLCDAVEFMTANSKPTKPTEATYRFDIVDIDPYGTCSPFIDSAVQCVTDGGLLCATCTDTAVLCGAAQGTCFGKYGSVPYRGAATHESALRILLHCLQSHASRHSRYIEPLLSVSADFYVRVFVRVRHGQGEVKRIAHKLAMLYYCPACDSRCEQPLGNLSTDRAGSAAIQPARAAAALSGGKCCYCGTAQWQLAGPLWRHPIHCPAFVQRLLKFLSSPLPLSCQLATATRLTGMLTVIAEELTDCPLFYSIDKLARAVKCSTMPMRLARSALLNANYRVSISHCERSALKTNAPPEFVWDIVQSYYQQFSIRVAEKHLQPGSLPHALLVSRVCSSKVDFTLHPQAEPKSKTDGLLRFHVPPPNWGPKPRAKRAAAADGAGSNENDNKSASELANDEAKKSKEEEEEEEQQ